MYICLANRTNEQVYVSGEDNVGKVFSATAKPSGRYWWWRRERSADRNLAVWLNGQKYQAQYKWTWQNPTNIVLEQACFFNKWEIKKNQQGKPYLEYASGDSDS